MRKDQVWEAIANEMHVGKQGEITFPNIFHRFFDSETAAKAVCARHNKQPLTWEAEEVGCSAEDGMYIVRPLKVEGMPQPETTVKGKVPLVTIKDYGKAEYLDGAQMQYTVRDGKYAGGGCLAYFGERADAELFAKAKGVKVVVEYEDGTQFIIKPRQRGR